MSTPYDVSVVGLGYIGLPTASLFATNGLDVLGVDVDPNVVRTVNDGEVHIEEPGLRTMVNAAVQSGQLEAATEPAAADVHIVAVPTPSKADEHDADRRVSDLSHVQSAVRALVPHLEEGNIVILESTSPPKTTERYVAEPLREAGWTPGEDIFVAHCPERVLPGNIIRELTQNDRTIGGITDECAQKAAEFYRPLIDGDIHTTGATTAELVKLMENTYRDVNIALANELADICDDLQVDVTRVIELANYHPRVDLHRPGPGVGGHCLPIDPWFVVESTPDRANLIRQARRLNAEVPHELASDILQDLSSDTADAADAHDIALFGVSYKGNVDDTRETPARDLLDTFEANGANTRIYDPHASNFAGELLGLEAAVHNADALVISAAHDEFKYLDPATILDQMSGRRVYDLCNLLDADKWRSAGATYQGRGVPQSDK
jgi:UDP-N-acetyl-D-mannosaminuronic acid dehydrogenase